MNLPREPASAPSQGRIVEAEESDDFAVIEAEDQTRAESQFGGPAAKEL